MLPKKCLKRENFFYKGMLARPQLAAIDNNTNVEREHAVVKRKKHQDSKVLSKLPKDQ